MDPLEETYDVGMHQQEQNQVACNNKGGWIRDVQLLTKEFPEMLSIHSCITTVEYRGEMMVQTELRKEGSEYVLTLGREFVI